MNQYNKVDKDILSLHVQKGVGRNILRTYMKIVSGLSQENTNTNINKTKICIQDKHLYIYIHLPHHTLSTYSLSVNLEVWLVKTLLVNVINSTLFKVRVTVISLMESTATANVSLLIYELFRMSIHKYTILYYIKGALFTILMR